MKSRFIQLIILLFIISGCVIIPPITTCEPCYNSHFPADVITCLPIYISSTKKISDRKYTGKKEINLQEGNVVFHFKQCPNVKLYTVKIKVLEKQDTKKDKCIIEFECSDIECYKTIKIPKNMTCIIEVITELKLGVRMKICMI